MSRLYAPVSRYRAVLLLIALVAVAFLIRVLRLGTFPANLTADEADNMAYVLRILHGAGPGFFGLDWKPAPAFSMYITAPFVALFHESLFGLRFLSALVGALLLLPLYSLFRRYVGSAASLLALALLATNVWYLNFSRSGWENIDVALFTVLAFWLLTRAIDTQRWTYWALSGLMSGLGLYSYFAGRAILISLLAYAPLVLWQHRARAHNLALGYALLTVIALAVFIPQLPSIKADPKNFNLRASRVSVLHARDDYLGHHGVADVLLYQVGRNARFFFDGSVLGGPSYSPPEQMLQDTRPRYSPFGQALLDPVTALLFAAGLVLSLLAGLRYSMWWMMLLVPWVLVWVLTINTPDAARGIGMLPAIYFFVALTLDRLWRLARRPELRAGLTLLVMVVAVVDGLHYVSWASSQELLAAREPAVPLSQYDAWRRYQVELIESGQRPVPVTTWKQIAPGG